MNKSFPIISILAAIILFAIAFGALAVQAQSAGEAAPNTATYQAVLGKSLNDQNVADFIASNHCSKVGPVQACKTAGLALWIGQGQKVETVYLYPNKTGDFRAYKGNLPFGLAANDTMASVEQKFGQDIEVHAPQVGRIPGLPEEGKNPDHFHYWAIYRRFGVTIVYNSPSASDKSATIYAVLVNK